MSDYEKARRIATPMRSLAGLRLVAGIAAAALLAVNAGTAAAQIVVDTCGQRVFGNAVLAGDLDCSGSAETYAVYLENPATLDMAGHTIFANNKAVGCRKPCNVISSQPGALITGAK